MSIPVLIGPPKVLDLAHAIGYHTADPEDESSVGGREAKVERAMNAIRTEGAEAPRGVVVTRHPGASALSPGETIEWSLSEGLVLPEHSPHFPVFGGADIDASGTMSVREAFDGTLEDFSETGLPDEILANVTFQLLQALAAAQRAFGAFHGRIDRSSVLYKRIPSGGYWDYVVDDMTFHVPNLGMFIALSGFGEESRFFKPSCSITGDPGTREVFFADPGAPCISIESDPEDPEDTERFPPSEFALDGADAFNLMRSLSADQGPFLRYLEDYLASVSDSQSLEPLPYFMYSAVEALKGIFTIIYGAEREIEEEPIAVFDI